MGKLLDAIASETSRGKPICGVATLRCTLSSEPELLADFEHALADDGTYATVLSRVLDSMGYKIGSDAIQRHRRGECHCGRAS